MATLEHQQVVPQRHKEERGVEQANDEKSEPAQPRKYGKQENKESLHLGWGYAAERSSGVVGIVPNRRFILARSLASSSSTTTRRRAVAWLTL